MPLSVSKAGTCAAIFVMSPVILFIPERAVAGETIVILSTLASRRAQGFHDFRQAGDQFVDDRSLVYPDRLRLLRSWPLASASPFLKMISAFGFSLRGNR